MKYPMAYIGQVLRMMKAAVSGICNDGTFSADYGRVDVSI